MIIVLFLGAIAGIYFGLWLRRRHRQKHSHDRETMLAAEDATNDLRNKHPGAPSSMTHIAIPSWDGSVLMSGANQTSRNDSVGYSIAGNGKSRADHTVKEMDLGDIGPSSPDEERNGGLAQSLSSKLRKSSKGSRRSRR
jgi:hypothetical protein